MTDGQFEHTTKRPQCDMTIPGEDTINIQVDGVVSSSLLDIFR